MRVQSAILALGALVAGVAAIPREDPSYSLVWKPTEGQAIDYAFSATVKTDGSTVEFQTDIHVKVVKVEKDGGYTLETKRDHLKVITDGQVKDVPDEDEDKVHTDKHDARGKQLSADDDDDDPDAMTALLKSTTDFDPPEKPLKKGEKWASDIKADPDKKISAAHIDYEILGEGKSGRYNVVNVSVKYRQTKGDHPASFDGTLAFDLTDMSPVSIETSVKDAPLDEDSLGEVKISMTRK